MPKFKNLVCLLDDKKRKFFPYCRFDKSKKSKGGSSLSYLDREDVWVINREYWNGDIKTPTKLPAEIIRKTFAYSSAKGDVVLDPFLGSGQVAVVSKINTLQSAIASFILRYLRCIASV